MPETSPEPERPLPPWQQRLHDRAVPLGIVAVLGVFASIAHFTVPTGRPFNQTAALYIGLPVLIALAFTALPRSKTATSGAVKWTTILLLLSVPVLREGFICVIFAAPIFYGVAGLVGGLIDWAEHNKAQKRGTTEATLLLALIAASSLEGAIPALTVERGDQVVTERTIRASLVDVEAQLAEPMRLDRTRSLFLRIFPMPVRIDGSGAEPGSERRLQFVYAKWIWWNIHTGQARFRIERPAPNHIRYIPVSDTSYLAGYLGWRQIDLHLDAIDPGTTRARLEIRWQRQLDPAWYFGPLQRAAVARAAETLLDNGVVPAPVGGALLPAGAK